MGRNGVKVIIRTRPTVSFATHQLQIDPDDSTITVYNGAAAIAVASGGTSPPKTDGGPSNHKDCWQFKFHQVLHNAGQDRVYEAIARDIVHGAVVDGVNGTILAYGQTGAGKSFTMIGDTRNYQKRDDFSSMPPADDMMTSARKRRVSRKPLDVEARRS